jgi:hypothetical protein
MNITLSSNAVNLINMAQHKSADASKEIAALPIQKNEVGSTEYSNSDIVKPVLSLKEAELETSAAIKLLDAERTTTGTLLDIIA